MNSREMSIHVISSVDCNLSGYNFIRTHLLSGLPHRRGTGCEPFLRDRACHDPAKRASTHTHTHSVDYATTQQGGEMLFFKTYKQHKMFKYGKFKVPKRKT